MPADTAEKRFSAMHISCPWRGLNLSPSTIDLAERQAVMFMYSGIEAAAPAVGGSGIMRLGINSEINVDSQPFLGSM